MQLKMEIVFDGKDPVAEAVKFLALTMGTPALKTQTFGGGGGGDNCYPRDIRGPQQIPIEGIAASTGASNTVLGVPFVDPVVTEKRPVGRPRKTPETKSLPPMPFSVGAASAPTLPPMPFSGGAASTPPQPQPSTVPLITEKDVQAALTSLFEAQGLETSLAVLARFGCKRLADLKKPQYEDFMQMVQDAISGRVSPSGAM